jgi:glutamate--cysteine ligase
MAPVDTNLFPGGFNNLSPDFMALCVHATMGAVEKICTNAQRLLLIPENHTRNTFYLQNVAVLASILRQTGLIVRIGTLIPEITEPTVLQLPAGGRITLEPVVRKGNRIGLQDFDPCAVLLNNDLSSGVPKVLNDIEQIIMPPLHAGWATRRKSRHFAAYQHLASEFSRMIGMDPWFIDPLFDRCGKIDFQARQGEECLASSRQMPEPTAWAS